MSLALLCAAGPAQAESLTMSLDRATALNFLRAATPYTVSVGAAGLTEKFRFYNPRDLRFVGGKVLVTADCKGEPIPFTAVLTPTLALSFDHVRNAFIVTVEKLPVKLTGFGEIRLDQFIDPVAIPATFTQQIDAAIPGLTVEAVVRDLKVLDDRIEARADLMFRKEAPTSAAAKQ
jgi:hypothetical protein